MTRKSKREIERTIDDLAPEPGDEYPHVESLAMLLGYEWDFESLGEERLVEREGDGKVFYVPEEFETAVCDVLSGDE
ncbi:hypothetical protein [Salarchaeum sp. JOR-1]|uniref:hypothetical protein n=1 Tax=Salarchaeum sp. JOR-1 TaxID=2599399 RepID=UPI00119849AA|nr:hypothetical protein [Salarchaeum sp. JOR-1]QDX40280.1 hypothetical protein FQU85_04970 [Salarchaeum sp. JOR-1]